MSFFVNNLLFRLREGVKKLSGEAFKPESKDGKRAQKIKYRRHVGVKRVHFHFGTFSPMPHNLKINILSKREHFKRYGWKHNVGDAA